MKAYLFKKRGGRARNFIQIGRKMLNEKISPSTGKIKNEVFQTETKSKYNQIMFVIFYNVSMGKTIRLQYLFICSKAEGVKLTVGKK